MYTSDMYLINGMSAMQNITGKLCVGRMVYDSILNILSTEKNSRTSYENVRFTPIKGRDC